MEWTAELTTPTKCKYCKNDAVMIVGIEDKFMAICAGCEEVECVFCEKAMPPTEDGHEVCTECREKNEPDSE